jgi:hypothetical protein
MTMTFLGSAQENPAQGAGSTREYTHRMKFPWLSGGRPSPDEVPLEHIADLAGDVRTARFASVIRMVKGDHRQMTVRQDGLFDYGHHLGLFRTTTPDGIPDRLLRGPDVLQLLSADEQRETGKVWKWVGSAEPNWETERAETVAAIRHLAQPTVVAVELVAGERVRRYSLRIRPRRQEKDPLLAGVYEHVRRCGIKLQTHDLWITADGRLVQTREHATMFRSHSGPGRVASYTQESWDFGIDLAGLPIPATDEILHRDEPVRA